jgi:hypothetical protein
LLLLEIIAEGKVVKAVVKEAVRVAEVVVVNNGIIKQMVQLYRS